MARFLIIRGLGAVGVLFALVTLVFLLQSVVPGDPVRARVGANATDEAVARERHRLGLDRPLPAQYVSYVADATRGDLGESIRTSRSVSRDVREFLPATLELAGFALILAVVLGGLLGITAATARRGSGVVKTVFLGGASAPTFLLGFLLIYVFYLQLGWLPASGQSSQSTAPTGPTHLLILDGLLAGRPSVTVDALQHILLPAISLALLPAVAIGRVLRSSLIEVLEADYIRTARSKGLRERKILLRHALRNAMSAPLTMTGLQFGLMLGGVVVIETIFAWPGIGLYTDQSIAAGDLPAIAGVTMVLAAVYVLVSLLVDLAQAIVDPRIQL
jgi:peptide/nickel transport system permease protein